MMYLKQIWSQDQNTLTITEAQKVIGEGENVCVSIFKDEMGHRSLFDVTGVTKITEDKEKGIIFVKNNKSKYQLNGWNTKMCEIHISYFIDVTADMKIYYIPSAKKAVEEGHVVYACNKTIQTDKIVSFDREGFVTESGKIYTII